MNNKRSLRFQKVLAVVALVALMIPLAGTSSVHAAAKVLRYQAAGEPATIDPDIGAYTDGIGYDYALFAHLLRYDHNNQPSPYLATDVPTVANGGISADG